MRGNPVMKAKRVTGPSPNTELCLRVLQERCKCGGNVTVSMSSAGAGIVRKCLSCHVGERPNVNVRPDIAAEMWWARK